LNLFIPSEIYVLPHPQAVLVQFQDMNIPGEREVLERCTPNVSGKKITLSSFTFEKR
jgi:hypothetical protein